MPSALEQQLVACGIPSDLTYGLVTPEEVNEKRNEYSRSLDGQQRQARDALVQQFQRQQDYLQLQADQQKAIAAGRWDQRFREEEMQAEQEYQQEVAKLRDAARQLKTALSTQATQLIVEYNSRKVQDELNHRIYEAEFKEWEECQHLTAHQMNNAAERLNAQMAFACANNTTGKRQLGGLPELPVDRWVPDGLRELGGSFGGLVPCSGEASPMMADAVASTALAGINAAPYPLLRPHSSNVCDGPIFPLSSSVY